MKIVCDENIQFAKDFFTVLPSGEPTELVLKAGRHICAADLHDADCLLVRSVTKVGQDLLSETSVRFVGSATIGVDHIDQAYLRSQDIRFAYAAGCSAKTVAQYVLVAIHHCQAEYFASSKPTIGIVGYGHIGTVLACYATKLGWHVQVCDPFKQALVQQSTTHKQAALDELLATSDIVSLHVPLTTAEQSAHPTRHLLTKDLLDTLKPSAIVVNTARGAVISEAALLDYCQTTPTSQAAQFVLDVFEHEPMVCGALVQHLAIATPHIAGYSLEGKARGTQLIYDAWCHWQHHEPKIKLQTLLPANAYRMDGSSDDTSDFRTKLRERIGDWYDIAQDDSALRHCAHQAQPSCSECFDALRKNYPLRREWLI